MYKKIILFTVLYITLIVFLTFTVYFWYNNYKINDNVFHSNFSMDDSQKFVENYINTSLRFKTYKGTNLKQIGREKINCESCYRFSYKFDSSLTDPYYSAKGFEMIITTVDNKIKIIETYEISANNKRVLINPEKDEYGCVPGSGFSWCKEKNRCISWEENCE